MEAALAQAFISGGGMTAGAAAVKAGAVMSGIKTAATGISLLSGVASGFQQNAAYKQQAMMYNQQARAADLQAGGTQLQAEVAKAKAMEEGNLRRERLLKALAAQNASAGAGGVTGGTVSALALQSVEDYSAEQRSADLMSQAEQTRIKYDEAGYRSQAAGARLSSASSKTRGKAALTGSLLSFGTQLRDIG